MREQTVVGDPPRGVQLLGEGTLCFHRRRLVRPKMNVVAIEGGGGGQGCRKEGIMDDDEGGEGHGDE